MSSLAWPTCRSNVNNLGFSLYYPDALPNYETQDLANDRQYPSKCSRTPIPLDAPIQSRTYLTPSATARKAVPAYFTKGLGTAEQKSGSGRRHRSSVHDAFSLRDGGHGTTLSLTAEQVAKIENRRNRNAFSARLSRKRKAEQMAELEKQRDDFQEAIYDHRNRIAQLEDILRAHNIVVPLWRRRSVAQQ
ncbi:hypothetical protein APHAL10511_005435 [Amanita phalloides]|nr:hypothetical protein APHAL10511_005435 [Amanita phalloides]